MYRRSIMRRFVRHIYRTWKQKLVAVSMLAIGVLTAVLAEGDITALIIISLMAVPMFLSNRTDWLV